MKECLELLEFQTLTSKRKYHIDHDPKNIYQFFKSLSTYNMMLYVNSTSPFDQSDYNHVDHIGQNHVHIFHIDFVKAVC